MTVWRVNSQPFSPSGDGTELNSHCNRFYNLAFGLSFKLCRSRYPMSLTQQATFSSDGTSELKGAHIALDQVEPLPLSRLLLVPSLQFSVTLQSVRCSKKKAAMLVVHHLALQLSSKITNSSARSFVVYIISIFILQLRARHAHCALVSFCFMRLRVCVVDMACIISIFYFFILPLYNTSQLQHTFCLLLSVFPHTHPFAPRTTVPPFPLREEQAPL